MTTERSVGEKQKAGFAYCETASSGSNCKCKDGEHEVVLMREVLRLKATLSKALKVVEAAKKWRNALNLHDGTGEADAYYSRSIDDLREALANSFDEVDK